MPRQRSRTKSKRAGAEIDFSPEPRFGQILEEVLESTTTEISSSIDTRRSRRSTAGKKKLVKEQPEDLASEEEEEEDVEEEEDGEEEVDEEEVGEEKEGAVQRDSVGDFDDGGFVQFAIDTFYFHLYGSIAVVCYALAVLVFVITCAWLAPDAGYLKNLIVEWQPSDLNVATSDEDRKDAYALPHKAFIHIPGLPGLRLFGHNVHDVPAEGTQVDYASTAMGNLVLLCLVAAQLTIMNLPFYRKEIIGFISPRLERSIFLFVSAVSVWFLIEKWDPLPHCPTLWTAPYTDCFWVMFFSGGFLAVISTFMDDHFQASGLKQAFGFGDDEDSEDTFPQTGLYRYVRQPAKLGFLIMVWSTPMMTGGRLLFALFSTVYLVLQSQLEDNQNKEKYGAEYEEYVATTPMLVPVQLLT